MSLLMDALKRAESSKQEAARQQAGRSAEPAAGTELSLTPLAGKNPAPASQPLPDLATHIEAVDADLARSAEARPAAEPAPAPAFTATAATSQSIARNAFAAKETPAKASRTPLWLTLGLLALAGIGIAGYVWFQLNSMGGSSLSPAGGRPNAPAPQLPVTLPSAPPPAPASAIQAEGPLATVVESRQPTAPTPPRFAEPPRNPAPAAPIRLARTPPAPDPSQVRAHRALEEGRLEQASQDFLAALQRDPNNVDALLALAAIAQYQGRANEAEGWRQRALVADPSHPAAQAAILGGTAASIDPQATESRLKTLLAAQPQSAELNFALGNLYAGQRRWPEAQQAYFNAVAADADNPDYLFNLAVSLDQLRQARPAAQHYRLALEAAARRPAAFDPGQARRRMAELAP